MPLNLEYQNKTKGMRSCLFVGVSMGGQRRLSLSRLATDLACCCSLTLLNPLAEKCSRNLVA